MHSIENEYFIFKYLKKALANCITIYYKRFLHFVTDEKLKIYFKISQKFRFLYFIILIISFGH